ncbi:MAG: TnpV protein [Clostridia bacterium]|nr:TnpV protein [Clostridia bacterium]
MSELTYTTVNGYQIPNVTLPEQEATLLNKYGRMRKQYLQEHRPILFQAMLLNGTLQSHLAEISQTAEQRIEQMMPELAKAAGVTEELKAKDQMAWVGLMNNCKAQAEEVILPELIYA